MPFNSITNALAKEGSCMYGRWISWSDISNFNRVKNMYKEDLNMYKEDLNISLWLSSYQYICHKILKNVLPQELVIKHVINLISGDYGVGKSTLLLQ
ncbi:hypothetical protein P8452_62123 [Trifolium repens]|nr:hypothetical protein P8452_62123 [Trifolium repens]